MSRAPPPRGPLARLRGALLAALRRRGRRRGIQMLRRLPSGRLVEVEDPGLVAPDGSRRVQATFIVECAGGEACARVRALMRDCEVADSAPGEPHRHEGTRFLPTTDDARARMREIKRAAGAGALVSVWVVS